ncbi:MFS transporter [Paraburkholderia caribensis]|uniref:MFS transporter n=1 Tax=Paraburkholderia caribensis TaxID=75105 RepID=UPI0034D1B6D7
MTTPDLASLPRTELDDEDITYAHVTRRVLPFLCLCFVIAFLDRVNISFAKLQMVAELGWSEQIYGLGAGMFFVAYFVFEIPSNLIMLRVGARLWIARIMITWALLTAAMSFVHSPMSFYVIRFLIGAAEAGFFPGVILYLTYWYPARRRSQIIALFMTAIPISGVLGGLVSGWIMSSLDRHHGLSGWQWLFIVESIPSLLVGIAALLYLDDGIEAAKWLTPKQKAFLRSQLAQDNAQKSKQSIAATFTNGRVWLLALVYFGSSMGQYGFGFWLPTIIRQTGVASALQISLLSAIPYAFGVVAMLWVGRSADKRRERRFHFAVPAALGAVGLLGCGLYSDNTILSLTALTIACVGLSCLAPVFWAIPTAMLDGAAAAAGIALINCLGNLAGFVSPFMMGWLKDHTGSTSPGMAVIAAWLFLAAALVIVGCKRATVTSIGTRERERPRFSTQR